MSLLLVWCGNARSTLHSDGVLSAVSSAVVGDTRAFMCKRCRSLVFEGRVCKLPNLDTAGRDRRQSGILDVSVMQLESESIDTSGVFSRDNSSSTTRSEVVTVKHVKQNLETVFKNSYWKIFKSVFKRYSNVIQIVSVIQQYLNRSRKQSCLKIVQILLSYCATKLQFWTLFECCLHTVRT